MMTTSPNTVTLEDLLSLTVASGASDLHLSAAQAISLRIDGMISTVDAAPFDDTAIQTLLKSIMTIDEWQVFQGAHDVDFAISISLNNDTKARFRVNAFVHQHGAAAVFRVIPSLVPSIDILGFDQEIIDNFRQIAKLRQGLVLVTGATGSGKSTTLAAIIHDINLHRPVHILTLEDPIEFVHTPKLALINQRQIGQDSLSFSAALRAGLRQDPDVILIGELRDLTSIRLALTAAETGHLVLATLHTRNATGAIDRIVDVFDAAEKSLIRTMLANSLQAVISQQLIPKQGGGRIAAHEILRATPAVRNLIRENKPAQIITVMQTGKSLGMQSIHQSLDKLLARRLISQAVYDDYIG